jgi:hypothetical protein
MWVPLEHVCMIVGGFCQVGVSWRRAGDVFPFAINQSPDMMMDPLWYARKEMVAGASGGETEIITDHRIV